MTVDGISSVMACHPSVASGAGICSDCPKRVPLGQLSDEILVVEILLLLLNSEIDESKKCLQGISRGAVECASVQRMKHLMALTGVAISHSRLCCCLLIAIFLVIFFSSVLFCISIHRPVFYYDYLKLCVF